jgi:Fic family protein
MKWNWQKKGWPQFCYHKAGLEKFEATFLRQAGVIIGTTQHMDEDEKSLLVVDIISNEAFKTSEIEGEYLNRQSVQSSIRRNFGLKTSDKNISPAEQGIAKMMVGLYQDFSKPLTHKRLFDWHAMLMSGRSDLETVGGYRKHSDSMQVISASLHEPKIHFEAPPSHVVKKEMDQFIRWFNDTAPTGGNPLAALTRAGIAHLYFVCIHPFEDGNGRIGRAIAEKALSQCLGQSTLIALSQTISVKRKQYYEKLELNNKNVEITDWLMYFAETILEAQSYSQSLIDFLIKKTKLFDKVKDQLNERQEKALKRMFKEGIKGFDGGLSAENYISITKTSRATATRDLKDLLEKGVFKRTGKLKATRYHLKI